MTIQNRNLNNRLSNLETCAERAPDGTYQDAKDTVEAISNIANNVMHTLSAAGLKVTGDDRLRNLEVAVYEYIVALNPDRFASAEGFGEHIQGPAGERILDNTVRDRDFLVTTTQGSPCS